MAASGVFLDFAEERCHSWARTGRILALTRSISSSFEAELLGTSPRYIEHLSVNCSYKGSMLVWPGGLTLCNQLRSWPSVQSSGSVTESAVS